MTARPAPISTADLARPVETADVERDVRRDAEARADQPTPMFLGTEAGDFKSRWVEVQTGFVDEPRRAVEQADELVAGVMKRLAETFATERATLESQWARGEDVTTEDLRLAMQRYRSFFDRLLSI